MTEFSGFGPKALAFFEALRFHQSKEWFDANRALYESDVVEPMVALLDMLTALFADNRIPLRAEGKRSIFRLNRDIRFSKDKSPYKTHAGAVMTRSGNKKDSGLLYIHIDPTGCFVAAGFYQPDSAALNRLREAIRKAPKRAVAMETALEAGGLTLDTGHQLTRVPRGFETLKDGPLDGMIRLKSFIVEETLPEKLVTRPDLVPAVGDFAKRATPLLEFGWKASA